MNEKIKRLDLTSADGVQLNLDALYQIAPSCFTEARDPKTGELKRVVNFDALRQLLGDDAVDESRETYEFRWVGKDAAKAEAARAIDKTLRPVVEDSVDWDTTKNLYIEGDNLEVLKLLQRSYMGKVKMIYIDPPYNTGNDFVYHDDFAMSSDEYDEASGAVDELGNRYVKNTETSGRFHSDWCNMIYPRLMVARSLLSEDGVIFISIDDNEVENLRKICDEVFGEGNFESVVSWRRRTNQPNDKSKMIAKVAENIVVYAKNSVKLVEYKGYHGVPFSEKRRSEYTNPDNDPKGAWSSNPWKAAVGRGGTKYAITTPAGVTYEETWYGTKENFELALREGRVHWTDSGKGVPRIKVYLKEAEKEGQAAINFFTCENFGSNQEGTSEVEYLFKQKGLFDNPKPTKLIKALIGLSTHDDSVVLDFFSGSATTAHAVMQLNAEDGGNRKFILVQLPEETTEDSEAYKAGYKNICEIGKERIRRAAAKIKEESPLTTQDLDTGFRVFRLDDSNFNPGVKAAPNEYDQEMLDLFADNIKSDRTDLDLLFGSILAWGLQLDLPMTTEEVDGCKIYTVNDGDLVACFAEKVSDQVIEAMAEKEPLRVLFRDACFDSDDKKINLFETFKQKLDWTDNEAYNNIRVI